MTTYYTPEELSTVLKVETEAVLSLIEEGKLQALKIGSSIRIAATEVEKLHVTCAVRPKDETMEIKSSLNDKDEMPSGSRWVATRTGRARFRVAGTVENGVEIWPGQMKYPIKMPKQFMVEMLSHFAGKEAAVGGKFDDPGRGTLGAFITEKLNIKMNPAVYVAALLIDEGYAEQTKRGYIRFGSTV